MPRVAIVGSGLIGRSWAIVFSRAGIDVALYDSVSGVAGRASEIIAADLEELASQGILQDAGAALSHIRVAASLQEALEGADLVQENVPETLDAKIAVFAQLDATAAPEVILASSTSGIVASSFTETLKGRARCLVGHPVNPPHLAPVVEVVGAPWTSPEVIERVSAIYAQVGQSPVIVKKEIDGFVINRLQAALLSEAFRLVGGGYISPQDLDKTIKDGLGLRWSFMGPFETIELNAPGGIPDYCQRFGDGWERMSNAQPGTYAGKNLEAVMSQWEPIADADASAARMQWRNRRLAALGLHKKSQPEK
jgi:3-hydroxyacyl-CoA dehydrogenase